MENLIIKLKHLFSLYVIKAKSSGLLKTPKDDRDFKIENHPDFLGAGYVPKHTDWVIKTVSVKAQMYNTCSFNSACVQKEIDEKVVLSPRGIISWGVKNGLVSGDGFADLRTAQKAMQSWGILEQGVVPDTYGGVELNWSTYANVDLTRFGEQAKKHKIKSYWFVSGRYNIIKLLDEGKVLDTGIDWYTGFNQGGGFSSPWLITKPLGWRVGGHAVAIVGYKLNYHGYPVYVIQNSYGNNWGDGGKFYIDMNYFEANNYGVIANMDIDSLDAKLINNKDMIIKKKDAPALYATCGTNLIPFSVSWDQFQAEFPNFPIVEITDEQFKKFTVVEMSIYKN